MCDIEVYGFEDVGGGSLAIGELLIYGLLLFATDFRR